MLRMRVARRLLGASRGLVSGHSTLPSDGLLCYCLIYLLEVQAKTQKGQTHPESTNCTHLMP